MKDAPMPPPSNTIKEYAKPILIELSKYEPTMYQPDIWYTEGDGSLCVQEIVKYWPVLYSELLYKMGTYFLDIKWAHIIRIYGLTSEHDK